MPPPQRAMGAPADGRGTAPAQARPAVHEAAAKPGSGERAAPPASLRTHFLTSVLFLALALVFTLPGSLSLGSGLLGYPGDNFQHAWFLWHFARAMVHGRNPFYTRLMFYPSGANLAWSTTDPLAGLIALPLSVFAGAVVAYNGSILLQLALAGISARLLCLRIARNEAAAFIGGMVFGFSPYLMAHALAHLSLVTAFPIPLFVLALDRIFSSQRTSWRMGLPLGLALLLAAFAHYDYVVLCLVFAMLLLAIDVAAYLRAGLTGFLARIGKPVSVGAAVFLAGFSPLLWMLVADRPEIPASRGIRHIEVFSADLLGFLIPSWNHVFFGRWARHLNPALFASGIEGTVYVGVVVLALAALGYWKGRSLNGRWAPRAAILTAAFYALALGPRIHVLGHELAIPGPAALFFHLPFATFLSAPARFDVMVALCLAILCSLGVRFLLEAPANRIHHYGIVPLIVVLVMADYLTVPFPRSSTANPGERYSTQARTSAPGCAVSPTIHAGTVLTFPMVKEPYCLKSMWRQVADDGRYAIVDGYLSYAPPEIWKPFWKVRILRSLMSLEGENDAPIDAARDAASAAATIRKLNLKAVVVYDSPEREAGVKYVERVFGVKPERAGRCTVFALPRPKTAARTTP